MRRLGGILAAALLAPLLATVAAPAARASWMPAPGGTVTFFGCQTSGVSGDSVAASDGVVRGFVRAESSGCLANPSYVERTAAGWRTYTTPYTGRVLAVADDGATTFLLYTAADGLRLGARDHGGAYATSQLLSPVRPRNGDVVAYGGEWWALWPEPVAGGSAVFQSRTIGTDVSRQRITWTSPRTDDKPSIARLSDGSVVMAYQRYDAGTGRTDVLRGRSTGGDWTFAQVTTNGTSTDPSIAGAASRQLLAWTQAGRIAYADDTSGSWRTLLLTTAGSMPKVTSSMGRVFVAWTSTGRHAILAQRSGDVWSERDMTSGWSQRTGALAVVASGGTGTVLAPLPERIVAETQSRPSISMFRWLGAWVDLSDTGVSPGSAIPYMRSNGVRTLYLQTGRYNSTSDVVNPARIAAFVDAARAAGIRTVAWYLPAYSEYLDRDVRRTVAAARFRTPNGNRFDAVGVDIEFRDATSSGAEWNAGVRNHLQRVRAALGPRYPIAAIIPSPQGMALNPPLWQGFPWQPIGWYADVVMPMSYWSYRKDCPSVPAHCAYQYTKDNIAISARLTGLPVHLIGGVGNAVTTAEVADFVKGAQEVGVLGASLYDYATTAASFWPYLRQLSP